MKNSFPEQRFERLLLSLEHELLATSDAEIADVAAELGLKPDMKGSVALFGVTFAVDVTKLREKLQARAAADRPALPPKRRPKDEPPT
ncbi:MAG TPA: hypothetical protein VGQ27_12635 [Steroidobacteraceae bacterium]|nr:hypothetical protein [Steroidobacteraceae bacterium]